MTNTWRVLVVGPESGDGVEATLESHEGVSVSTVEGVDEGLYHLAANDVDCVVTSEAVVEGASPFAEALAGREDVEVVSLSVTDGETRPAADGESSVSSDVRDAIEAAMDGAADDQQSEPGTSSPAPLVVIVADGTIIESTGPAMPPLGHEPDALVGESVHEYVHPDDHDTLEDLLDDDGEDASGVLRFEHHDGDWREVRVNRRPDTPDRIRLDVYRRGVDELPDWFPHGEEAEEMLAVLYAHAPIHLYVKDEHGRHQWVSRYYSGNATDVIGKRDRDFDWGEFGERAHAADMEVIETGEPKLNEEEYVPFHDDWNLTSKVPWIDEEGTVQGLVGVTWRITKRKQYEKRLERENERLERFASIVSHDLRNPINVAMGNLELARETTDDEEFLGRIERALERMDRITDDVLTMAREGEWVTETERISLAEIARRAWDMVATAAATLEVDADVAFEGDPDRLHHLLENLFRNAVEHGGESVTVHVGPIDEGGFYVADDGVGMAPEYAEHAFETGQSAADGTGLGLEIVREVAEAHGWDVDVTESDDGGACFEVTGLATIE